MSPLFNQPRVGRERDALASRLRRLAGEMDRLADAHCEVLDFEAYSGLTEHAAELRAVARAVTHNDLYRILGEFASEAEQHIAFVESSVVEQSPSQAKGGGS